MAAVTAKRLYLIDGYSTIFRAFYAIRGLSTSTGKPTNAIYGFINMLRKLLREEEPALLGIALDVGRATVRTEAYAEYKANRSPMPEDLKAQMPAIRRAIEAFRIPILELERYEADDVIGTLGRKAQDAGYEVTIVSADKDLFQLVGDRVSLLHTGREKTYDPALVEQDFGVPPGQVVDVLALVGDKVDNVPGVPGIGQKGAQTLIREYGNLQALLEAASELKRKAYREGLQEHADQALLSRELVTIHTDLDVPFEPDALEMEAPDYEALADLCREFEFWSLLKELESESGGPEIEPAVVVDSVEAFDAAARGMGSRIAVGVVFRRGGEAAGLSFAAVKEGAEGDVEVGRACFADFRTSGLREAVATRLRAWLADPGLELVGHDLKEAVRLCPQREGRPVVVARLVDTMLMAYLVHSAVRSFGLATVALDRLFYQATTPADAGLGEPGGQAEALGDDTGLRLYAAEQAVLPALILEALASQWSESPGARKVYDQIEAPLLPVLAAMEEEGIELDSDVLAEMSQRLERDAGALAEEIFALAGESFNILSPQQLGVVLFEHMGLPAPGRTRKTKKYKTGADVLEQLARQGHDAPAKVLQYRELTKLKSTYVDALPHLLAEDGRLHTRYHQAVAATGRLSSHDPNLQNIPIRTDIGRQVRRAFRARDGYRLLVADYSQIELRVLAHISGDEALVDIFRHGGDIHRSTAATVFGVVPALVTDEQRRASKTINFGIIYGMSAFGLARALGIARGEAQAFIDAYFERFSGVRAYTEQTLSSAEETLQVETLYGRVRYIPDIKSRNRAVRENARRMAVNARIQGTAADLLKLAMIAVDSRLRSELEAARLLLTVHDELVLEAPSADMDALASLVREEMEGVADLSVPLVVDIGTGPDWYDAKA
ncbi:MAG: DNA polymerase I [Holophagales bacterium]|nr:DNA polymerase I [Holophagales bacterium]MYG30465.1 DNA polymerase I [Holophagales bacterium]MYI81511.1 DNA polymerase I [Holophagales bacterium]